MNVVDLFAGPGGWDLAAMELDIDVLGIEFDDAACATRDAAGLRTLQADVSALDPKDFPCEGLIASPPCQAFSMAGKGEGRKAIDTYVDAIAAIGRGEHVDRTSLNQACADGRAHLVLEPLRWALALTPDWIALEQVEPVLPIWQAMSQVLMDQGYYTWSGVLSAEQYGVPQTRRRAFLIARKTEFGIVNMPQPTHARYVAPQTKRHEKQEESLFDGGERERITRPDDRHLLPWVSMAEALGWVADDLVGLPRLADTDDVIELDGQKYRDRDLREASQPAQAVTEKGRSWQRWQLRANAQENAAVRSLDEPAPTIMGGHSTGERVWEPVDGPAPTQTSAGLAKGRDVWKKMPAFDNMSDNAKGGNQPRPADQHPAPTITGLAGSMRWTGGKQIAEEHRETVEAPASTIVGDERIPVRSKPKEREDGTPSRQNDNAIRVSQREAAILQSFPPDYPWQGSKTKQFQQIGNAVPPLLALAVLEAVVPSVARQEVAA